MGTVAATHFPSRLFSYAPPLLPALLKPLSDELLWEIDRVHMRNRLPIFSSTDVPAEWGGTGGIGEPIP